MNSNEAKIDYIERELDLIKIEIDNLGGRLKSINPNFDLDSKIDLFTSNDVIRFQHYAQVKSYYNEAKSNELKVIALRLAYVYLKDKFDLNLEEDKRTPALSKKAVKYMASSYFFPPLKLMGRYYQQKGIDKMEKRIAEIKQYISNVSRTIPRTFFGFTI